MTIVAIQGIYGSYSEQAAHRMLGDSIHLVECTDFGLAVAAVREDRAHYAVMPLRNKIAGFIAAVNALLDTDELKTVKRLSMEIDHVLAGTPDAVPERLVTVRSHPQALKQCSGYLTKNAQLNAIADVDTASSIRRVMAEGTPRNAAICSERAAAYYGAKVLLRNIANEKDNWTEFGLVGRK